MVRLYGKFRRIRRHLGRKTRPLRRKLQSVPQIYNMNVGADALSRPAGNGAFIWRFCRNRNRSTAGASPRPTVRLDMFSSISSANVGQGLAPAAQEMLRLHGGSGEFAAFCGRLIAAPTFTEAAPSKNVGAVINRPAEFVAFTWRFPANPQSFAGKHSSPLRSKRNRCKRAGPFCVQSERITEASLLPS